MNVLRVAPDGFQPAADSLEPIVAGLNEKRQWLAKIPSESLVALFADFAARIIRDPRTKSLEGCMFLSAWLGANNLRQILELNLNGNPAYLDGFQPQGKNFLAAKSQGLAAMWLAGNVATLPLFSLVPALLAKNVCLAKLATPDPVGMDKLLAVLTESEAGELKGSQLLDAAAVVWFDYRNRELNEQMSLAADVKIAWGGAEAVKAIGSLPRREHCAEIVFGPKYSIGVIDRQRLMGDPAKLEETVAAFVRDIAIFDQRACSAPQTIFLERNEQLSLRKVGEMFAWHLSKLPPKPALDAYTTMQIANARARWAMDENRDVIASEDGANWTVCLDREISLKEAVQSRTIFLTEIESWRQIIPLLSPKVQTAGIAFGRAEDAREFAEAATSAGVARCVRPGIMNNHESPWDGKLLIAQLVRWVVLKT
jgi:hypothetical protein